MDKQTFRVRCNDSYFSLSGVQNKVQQYQAQGQNPAETSAYALRCISTAVVHASNQNQELFRGLTIVFSGGVDSNSLLRQKLEPLSPIFAPPQYSTDNAMGVAVLTQRMTEG